MATPSEKLVDSLETLAKLQTADGAIAIRARDISRTHRERLLAQGSLQPVLKGWLIPRPPQTRRRARARLGMPPTGSSAVSIFGSVSERNGASRPNNPCRSMLVVGLCLAN